MIADIYDDRTAAIQAEIMQIEELFNNSWLDTIRALVAEQLPQTEFTARRMSALKSSLRLRKLAYARLRWKYDDTGRRRGDLVDRDVRRALAAARRSVDEYKQQQAAKAATQPAARLPKPVRTDLREAVVDLASKMLDKPSPVPTPSLRPLVRSLDGILPTTIRMISADTGIDDLSAATDDDILDAYINRCRVSRDIAHQYLEMLKPTA